MRSPIKRAARPLLALTAALAAATSSQPAFAQADPFALPENLTTQSVAQADPGPVLSDIVVDGQNRRRMVHLDGRGAAMTIDAADARSAGLPVAEDASGAIRLDSLKLYKWSFDPLRQVLKVALFRQNDGANFRDLTARERLASESTPLLALRVDYDLTATASPNGTSVGGLADAYLVRGNFSLGSSARVISNPQAGSTAFVRLDSQAQLAFENSGVVAIVGDFVSAGSQTQRALRLGGVQIATDFELRPDLVTLPLPAFSGSVAVPTSLDLIGADQRLTLGQIEPGDFTVRNIPAAPGRGTLSAVLRDSLGREVVETARFYVSRDLLAPTTTGYAVNAGFVRRRFGEASNDYGPFAASAFVRRGLSSILTVEASGEWTAGTGNVGARADFVIASLAKATVEGRFSTDRDAGSGTLINLAVESVGPRFGAVAGATFPGATYRDVASRLGDPAPPRQIFGNLYYRLRGNSQVQLAFVRRESRADPRLLRPGERSDVASASVQLPVTRRLRFFGSAAHRRSTFGNGFSISGGLSFNIGPGRHAAAYAGNDSGRSNAGISYTKDDLRDGDIGYRALASMSDSSQRLLGGIAWRTRQIRMEGEAEQVDGRFAGRINARGTLLVAGGTVYARNKGSSSYALVRAGAAGGRVAGVPITRENRLVGYTDANGLLLVQDIPPLANIKIDVDADKLPAEALVRETTHIIRVPRRAVTLVEIDAVRFLPVLRRLVDPVGQPLPAGLPVRMLPSDTLTLTGFDGMVEINAGSSDTRLLVGRLGTVCTVNLSRIDLERDSTAPLICAPLNIADETGAGRGEVAAAPPSKSLRIKRPGVAQRNLALSSD